jgi:glycosyltransferase involved in cell wall biosynthesis
MAMSKPVIATDVGGNPELVVEAKTGFLVPVGSADRLADRITKMLQDPRLLRSMGQEARRRAEAFFGMPRMIQRTVSLYEQLMAAHDEAAQ